MSDIKVNHNMLKLNGDKLIVFKYKHKLNTPAEQNVHVSGTKIGIS